MKKICFFITVLFCFQLCYCQHPYLLRGGTEIGIKTVGAASGDFDYNELAGVVTSDIYDNTGEKLIIRSGSPAQLHCKVLKPKTIGRPGKILVTGATTKAVNGTPINLNSNFEFVGEGKQGTAHGLAWGLAPFTCFLSCFFLFIKGGKAEVLSQSFIPNNIVEEDYYIELE